MSFYSNGGSTVSNITVQSGQTISKPRNPTKHGSTFKGWYKDSALTQSFTFGANGDKVTSNITLYAKWIEDSLLAEIAINKVSIGYQNGDSANHVTGNITLPRNIDVSGDVANIIWSSNNEKVIYTNGTVTRQSTDVTVVLTALSSIGTADKSRVFTLKVIHAETPATLSYKVSFNSNGGSSVSSITVPSGNTVTKPKDPSKDGYTFGGWYKDSALTQAFKFCSNGDKVTSNITLYAKWNISDSSRADAAVKKISIGYQDGDSSEHVTGNLTLPSQVDVSGDLVSITWSSNNPDVISSKGTVARGTSDIAVRLTATATAGTVKRSKTFDVKVIHVETPAPKPTGYTVTFNTNEGSSIPSVNVSSGATLEAPANPTKEGYVFVGWYKDDGFTEIFAFGDDGDKITKDTTLYAMWVDNELLLANYVLSEITIGYSQGDNHDYVTENLTLPSRVHTAEFNGVESVDIVWISNQPGVISSAGNVTRQNGSNVNVTLKATVYTKNEVVSRDFNLRVVRKTNRSISEIPTVTADNIAEMNNGDSEANISYGHDKQVVDIDGTFCGFKIHNAEDAKDSIHGIHEILGINDTQNELVFGGATSTDTGFKYCFLQSYDNAEVYGRRVLVSTNSSNNTNFMMSSFLSSDVLASTDLSAKITKAQAEGIAKGRYTGSFDIISDFTHQIIYSLNNYENTPVRAFVVRVLGVTTNGEYCDEDVIVNALNGEVINTMSNHLNLRIPQSDENELGKIVDFYTEYEHAPIADYCPTILLSNFMRDSETNVQIYKPWAVVEWTRDINLPDWLKKLGSKVAERFMIQAVRDNWDRYQVSAYTNMTDIMRWWKTTFHRNSLDNKGMKVKVVTHAVGMKNNAAWMRGLAGFGGERINIYENEEGSSYIHQPSAAADVLAHETTHAVLYYEISGGGWNYTAGNSIIPALNKFPYQNATGAIDEAYSDIFACIYDSKDEYGNEDWQHAEDWYGNNNCGRNIADPNNENAKDCRLSIQKHFTVGKAYSQYSTEAPGSGNDNNDVHKYSLLISHAAYLMHKYGMSYDLLGKLWYSTIYGGAYDATSNFHSVRNVVLKAAREKPELRSYVGTIERAFDEVGITEGDYYVLNITLSDEKNLDRDLSMFLVSISRDNEVLSLYSGCSTILPKGTYTVSVEGLGEYFPFSQEVDLRCDTTFNIKLSPIPRIDGTVYSSDRVTPLEGAEVSISSGRDNPNGDVISSMLTDSSGFYVFHLDTQKHGDYTVTIRKSERMEYFSITLNGEVNKDWYFSSYNEPDAPTPVPPDVPIISYDIPIDEAHFPDDVFRKYVSYKIDNNRDGILSKTEIESTVHIDVSEIDIWNFDYNEEINFTQSLKGVEYLAALQSLDCSDSQLTNLNVSKNTALRELRCDGSSITALSLSGCTALEILNCDKCQLTTLDVSNCSALKILYCSQNQLTALNVNKNTALQILECYENLLTTLDVSNNTSLETIYCSSNQLKALDVSNHEGLKYLYCNDNQLATLDVDNCISLIFLDCYNNQLIELDTSGLTDLMWLHCNNNQLITLDVSGCTSLAELSCVNNLLTTLDVSDLTTLQFLACNSNQLTTLKVNGTGLGELWCNDNQLTTLDLSDCFLLGQYRNNVHCDDDLRANIIWPPDTSATMSAKHTSSPSALSVSINDSAEILAVLPAFTPVQSGTYTFTTSLDRDPPEGSLLVILSDSEDIHGTFARTDSAMSVKVSADFTAGRTYSPVIVATYEGEGQSGGCNAGTAGIILLAGIILVLDKKP